MNINTQHQTNFTARNKTIQKADDIARLVNKCFPRVSPSKYASMNNAHRFENTIENLKQDLHYVRLIQNMSLQFGQDNLLLNITNYIKPIKRFKVGNCGESADLAALIASSNGIKNVKIARLLTPDKRRYDHAVVLVNDKKPYIIDAWLGFADYVPNAIKRFQKEFRQYFDFAALGTEKINIVPYENKKFRLQLLQTENFTKKQIEQIKKFFPEFILKSAD